MEKVDSHFLVCTAEQSQRLISLGILPMAALWYEKNGEEWDFMGEYPFDEENPLPAFTMGELHILIGGNFMKPDISGDREWTKMANMLEYVMYLPSKRRNFPQGAQAAAAFLEHLLASGLVKADECNARLESFAKDERHNPKSVALDNLQNDKI